MKFGNLLNESSDIRGSSQRESDVRSHPKSVAQPAHEDSTHAPSLNASLNPASPVESNKSARFSIGSLMNNDNSHNVNILNPSSNNMSHASPVALQTPYRERPVLHLPGSIPSSGNSSIYAPNTSYFQQKQPQPPPQHSVVPQMMPHQLPPARPSLPKRSSILALLNDESLASKPASESISSVSSPHQPHAQILNPTPSQISQGTSNYPDNETKLQIHSTNSSGDQQDQNLLHLEKKSYGKPLNSYQLDQQSKSGDLMKVQQEHSPLAPEASVKKSKNGNSKINLAPAITQPQVVKSKDLSPNQKDVANNGNNELKKPQPRISEEILQKDSGKMDIDVQIPSEQAKIEQSKPMETDTSVKKQKSRTRKPKKISNIIRPHKYGNPPVWAQDWVPLTKIKGNLQIGQHAGGVAKDGASLLTAYSSELEVSITKSIPYEDLTRRVTEWLYAHLNRLANYQSDPSLPQDRGELLKYLELEVKFGRIWSKERDSRINLPISTESIIINQVDYTFKPGVEPVMFDKLRTFLMGIQGKDMAAFKVLDTNNIDYFYHGVRVNEKPYDLRLTKDATTNRTIATIEKRRIADLFINCPSNILDFRISLSLELPIESIPKEIKGKKPNMIRHKVRKSYISEKTKCRMDLTDTTTEMNTGRQHSFEVEVESKIPWLIESFRSLNKGDSFTYQDTIKVLLDNCRILNRSLDN